MSVLILRHEKPSHLSTHYVAGCIVMKTVTSVTFNVNHCNNINNLVLYIHRMANDMYKYQLVMPHNL